MRRASLALVCLLSTAARADFVRGAIKIDVRDADGKPVEAQPRVTGPNGEAGEIAVARQGQVYAASGVVDGEWSVTVGGAVQRVRVRGRRDVGVVFVVGPRKRGTFEPALGERDRDCDGGDGILIEAVGFQRGGGLGAGRVDVRARGKTMCSAIVAGGAASLRLPPGDYDVSARFVGGGQAHERYRVRPNETPTPLVLRAR